MPEIQRSLYERAKAFRDAHTVKANSYDELKQALDGDGKVGNFVLAHWDGTAETEAKIKEETKATIRCIPFEHDGETGKCVVTGRPSKQRVLFARAY
jgi:prolyl-tRNA synthetase